MRYLFIESRSTRESPDVTALLDLAGRLREAGHEVTLFLVQNAVVAAAGAGRLRALLDLGVEILADDLSLDCRGLGPVPPDGVRRSGVAELVRLLMSGGVVASWH